MERRRQGRGRPGREWPAFIHPCAEATIEDPDRLEAIGAQTPPYPRREQALAVVVDDDVGPIADAQAGCQCGDSVRTGQQQLVGALGLDEIGPPIDVDRARDVAEGMELAAASIGAPAGIDDPDARSIHGVGEPRRRGQVLWVGPAFHRPYDTAVVSPFQPDADKLDAVRAAIPSLGAGIYLNTGSVGPLPAETAAAMAEIATWERDTGRGHVDSIPDVMQRLWEARAGVAAVMGTDVSAVALMHSTTDGMNAAALAIDWRPGDRAITTALEHPGGLGPLYSLRDRGTAALEILDVGDDGDDERTLAAFDAAITPGTRLVAVSHVAWTTGAILPVAADRRDRPCARGARRGRRCPGRRRHPDPLRRPGRGLLRDAGPEVVAGP